MKLALHVAALATLLGAGACTSVLGVDGIYEAGGGGDAGTTSSLVATSATSTTTTSASGGGAGGDDGVGGSGATVTSTGAGGGEDACPVCTVTPRPLAQPQGRRPRLAQLASELTLSFIHGGTVQIRRASNAVESESAAGWPGGPGQPEGYAWWVPRVEQASESSGRRARRRASASSVARRQVREVPLASGWCPPPTAG